METTRTYRGVLFTKEEHGKVAEMVRELESFCVDEPVKCPLIFEYPPCYKDMSFWINDSFTENNLCEVVRGIAGDLAEEVQLIDNFTNKKGMTSHCYTIAYRSMERSLTDEEINELQWKVRDQAQSKLKVVLR